MALRELNTPLPRWWLWLFYITIVWSIGYWIVYPAWPLLTKSTQGVFGYHTRSALRRSRRAQAAARADDGQSSPAASLSRSSPTRSCSTLPGRRGGSPLRTIARRAMARAAAAQRAIPISTTMNGCGAASFRISSKRSAMVRAPATTRAAPAACLLSARDKILKPNEISAVADYVRSLSGLSTEPGADLGLGKKVFADNCARLPRARGQGQSRDGRAKSHRQDLVLWFRQGRLSFRASRTGAARVMPAWGGRLNEPTIKALTVYVHTLGGGEK